jgi:Tol biopolymer transport system component
VSDIYAMSRSGNNLTRLTNTRRVTEDELDWSSRNLLVFRASRGRSRLNRYELYTMRPNGQDRRRLTNNHVPDAQPDWAPGGRRLTFVRGAEIWTMRARGGNASSAASGHSPTWAPDGSLIAFVSADDLAIHTVRPSGADDTLLGDPVDHGSIFQLDWQPR